MYCIHCGEKIEDSLRFCVGCSAPTGGSKSTSGSQTPQVQHPRRSTLYQKVKQDNKFIYTTTHRRITFRPFHLVIIFYCLVVISMLVEMIMGSELTVDAFMLECLFWFLAYVFYYLPSIIGSDRSNGWAIFWVNVLLGWTVIGWIVALIMSLSYDNGKRLESIEDTMYRTSDK
jgi:hypothetical protein